MTKRLTPPLGPNAAVVPLVDDPAQPGLVRELLQAGRDADVGGYDFEQGLRTHLALIASGAPTPPWADGLSHGAPGTAGTGAASAAAAGSTVVGWLTGATIGVAVVSATWFALQWHDAVPAPAAAPPAAVNAVDVPAAPPAPVVSARPAGDGDRPALGDKTALEPGGRPSATPPRRGRRAARLVGHGPLGRTRAAEGSAILSGTDALEQPQASPAPAPREATRPAQPSSTGAVANEAPVAPADEAVAAPAPLQQAERREAPQEAPQEDGKLEREMAMLSMTQRVLNSDPNRALSLARQGEAEFSGSMFTQERQQLLLLALVKLGNLDDARRLAKPFLQRYPTGPFSDRVRRALAAGVVER